MLPKKQKSKYANKITTTGKMIIAEYADKSVRQYNNTEENKQQIIKNNEKVIRDYHSQNVADRNINIANLTALFFSVLAIVGLCVIKIHVFTSYSATSGFTKLVGISSAIASYGTLLYAANAIGKIIGDMSNVKKAMYLMENKKAINESAKETVEKSFSIQRRSPYRGLLEVAKETGNFELNVDNVHLMKLSELKKLRAKAEVAKYLQAREHQSNVINQNNERLNTGTRTKKM